MQLNLESRRGYIFVSNKLFFYANQIRIRFCHYLYESFVQWLNIKSKPLSLPGLLCVLFVVVFKGAVHVLFKKKKVLSLLVFLRWISIISTFNHSLKKVNQYNTIQFYCEVSIH